MKSFFTAFKKQLLIIFFLALISLGLFYYNSYIYERDYSLDYGELTFDEDAGEVLEEGHIADVIREFLPLSKVTLGNQGETISLNRFWFEKGLVPSVSKDSKLDATLLFYVEYEARNGNDDEERKVLLRRKSEGNYEMVANFSETRGKWELESGEDLLFGKELVLYEKVNGEWASVK